MKRTLHALIVVALLAVGLWVNVEAQGPYAAQIQAAIRALRTNPATYPFTGIKIEAVALTFGNLLVTKSTSGQPWDAAEFVTRRSRGTSTNALAVSSGDTLAYWTIQGHDGTDYANAVQINARANQTWNGTQRGAGYDFSAVKNGTTSMSSALSLNMDGLGTMAFHDRFGIDPGDSTYNAKMLISRTVPTVGSGFGTSPTVPTANGTAAFTVNVGTGGSASAGVLTMPTATTGYNCAVENRTGVAANRANQRTVQTATTSTSVTVQNQTISTGAALAWTASDVLALTCTAY